MAKTLYCWRCKQDIPMLDEDEWQRILPYLSGPARSKKAALTLYFEMTGDRETIIAAIWHHRVSQYGPPCRACGKPLRTPQAKLCSACGTPRYVGPIN
jgi:hypothetical protein